jgi:hypothetical protein
LRNMGAAKEVSHRDDPPTFSPPAGHRGFCER